MFVRLTIENFRSVKENFTLDLSASGSNSHLVNHIYKKRRDVCWNTYECWDLWGECVR